MKIIALLALLFIGGAVYFVTGGEALNGLFTQKDLPETISPPNATFLGDEQDNPFAE